MLYYHTAILIGEKKQFAFIINHRLMLLLMILLLIISMYIYITVNRNNICSQFYEEMITMKNERFDWEIEKMILKIS